MEKKTFIFNSEWAEILADFSSKVRLDVYDAVVKYAITGELSELRPTARMAFAFIKREIDANHQKYQQAVEKRREAGKKGGAPKGNRNASKGAETASTTAATDTDDSQPEAKAEAASKRANRPAKSVGVDPSAPETCSAVEDVVVETIAEPVTTAPEAVEVVEAQEVSPLSTEERVRRAARRFYPPTLIEVEAFFAVNKFTSKPDAFFDYYSANGWKIGGKTQMKDWRAAARCWERREIDHTQQQLQKQTHYANNKYNEPTYGNSQSAREARMAEYTQHILNRLNNPEPEEDLSDLY